MFKTEKDMILELRERMRDGEGQTKILHIFTKEEMKGKCRLFGKIELAPGSSIGTHPHDEEEEIYYVLSGKGQVSDNGTVREVGPGDALITGGGESHNIACTGEEPLVFMAAINLFK